MKTYKERTDSVLEKVKLKKAKRRSAVMTGATSLALAALIATNAIWLMPNSPFRVDDSPLLEGVTPPINVVLPNNNTEGVLNSAKSYANVYDLLYTYSQSSGGDIAVDDAFGEGSASVGGSADDSVQGSPSEPQVPQGSTGNSSSENSSSNSYQEVTNNQVDGVIEADLFKRSDEHIFYLTANNGILLKVYSIEGSNSRQVAEYSIAEDENFDILSWLWTSEMYLSEDAKTITVILPCRYFYEDYYYHTYTAIVNVDVSDVNDIKETERVYLTGSYSSSRLTENGLLVNTNFYARFSNKDDTKLYIPHAVYGNEYDFTDVSDILLPDEITSTNYSYVSLLNEDNLSVVADKALLSYSSDVYVSNKNMYLAKAYTPYYAQQIEGEYYVMRSRRTDIACINYTQSELKFEGCITVEGHVDDQYSMDEKDGVLRVFTSTQAHIYSDAQNKFIEVTESASLYCIDLNEYKVIKAVENFAPYGESVRSARFDGNTAYVCTAVQFTDPVFAFNLSDYNNITYTNTGTIDGYSLSLMQFYGDTLLGIGYGDSSTTLKIEVYKQAKTTVESVAKFEQTRCLFSNDFKAYYVNAEKGLVGLAAYSSANGYRTYYYLFKFDGNKLFDIAVCPLEGSYTYSRATVIDDYLYVLTKNDFVVYNIPEQFL